MPLQWLFKVCDLEIAVLKVASAIGPQTFSSTSPNQADGWTAYWTCLHQSWVAETSFICEDNQILKAVSEWAGFSVVNEKCLNRNLWPLSRLWGLGEINCNSISSEWAGKHSLKNKLHVHAYMHKHTHKLGNWNQALMSFDKLPTALWFSVNLCSCVMLLAPLRDLKSKKTKPKQTQTQNKGRFCCISGRKERRNEWKSN